MYRAYLVPDATQFNNRSAMYQAKLLMWDPRSESDAYAVIGPKFKGELNKAEGFEFTILPANIRYSQIRKKLSVVIIYDDDEWIFEGVVSDCPKDFYKQMKVSCSGPLSYLCDSVQAPDEKNVVSIPTASGNTYAQVPGQWYNNANPHEQGWQERSYDEDGGVYTYTLTSDTSPKNKTYYYVVSGDKQNHSGSTITKKAATKETIQAHLERLLAVHNSQVDAFKSISMGLCVGDSTVHEFKSSNYRETWSAIKSDIIEQYGRYITIRMDDHYTLKLNYLELHDMDSHSTPETSITFTDNMIEMTESDDSDDDIFTVLVPTGKNNLTLDNLSGHTSPEHGDNRMVDPYVASWGDNKRYIVVSNYAIGRYGYIVKTQSFSDVSKVADLWTSAVKYIKNNFDAHTEYEVKGIDKYLLGESNVRTVVGKKCRVRSGWHGVDEKDLYVISAEHDLASPENDTYKIGIPTSDREARNKTLTGQTTSSSTNSANNYASTSSAIASLTDILDKYISEHEGWLDLSYKIRNKVESDNGMLLTRFEQDESHINLMAQKVFGVAGSDDVDNQDAGWILIPKPPYRKVGQGIEDYYENSDSANTTYKVPSDHNWYVKGSDGKYTLSTQSTRVTQAQVNDPNVNFYIMRLATRVSMIDVGEGGIKARVDGNYDRSTANSSWIDVNEDSILALTGHLYVDEDGHVHVTSGSGARTDHSETGTIPTYYPVTGPMLTDVHGNDVDPKAKGWYEQELDSTKAWVGANQPDANTNDAYYHPTEDRTVKRPKHYYYKSYVREKFSSEYGVYDEDNLTAGILVRTINNPTYKLVPLDERQRAQKAEENPRSKGWYEYDNKTGLYGITLDDKVLGNGDDMKEYFTVDNNMQSYTNVMGDHVVIGGRLDENGDPIIFGGVDDATKARIHKYIDGHKLDGTITEIASDVLYAKAIFTNYLNVLSHKLIGDVSDDGNFTPVDKTRAGYSDMNPSAEGWCEKNPSTNEYFLSADDKVDSGKTYYVTKLMTRITSLEVGEGGIHATVQGNYERSVKSMAWLEANEEKLEFLVGRVGKDADGNLVIDAGTGFRSGYTSATDVQGRYVLVLRSQYSGSNPNSKGWKERKIGPDGRWTGQGKTDAETNSAYYETSSDTSASFTKQYYVWSTTAETFTAEYGVFHEGNLTAGVVAQMVNHPKHTAIDLSIQPASVKANPSTASTVKLANGTTLTNKFWLVYDESHGTYARTTDTSVVNGHVYFYSADATSAYTDIKGEHIIIGKTEGYSGLDDATKAKVDGYLAKHPHLDGTITEIASDVVTINTLIAKYISAESIDAGDIQVGTWLRANFIGCNDLYVWGSNSQYCGLVATRISSGNYFIAMDDGTGGSSDWNLKHCILNDSYTTGDGPSKSSAFSAAVVGDEVTISYKLMDHQTKYFSFIKPASLGSVTWSSGNKTLTAKTVGGADFMVGQITPFQPTTEAEARSMANAVFLDTRTTGYETIYGINYTYKKPTLSDGKITGYTDTSGHTMLFKTPKNRYPDAISTVRTRSATNKGDGDEISLGVGGVSTIYAQYQTEAVFDDPESDTYTSLTGIKSYAPEIRIFATYDSTDYKNTNTINLDYGDSVSVKAQKKEHDEEEYSDYQKLTVSCPSLGTTSTYCEYDADGNGEAEGHTSGEITLDYSDSVVVKGRHQDGNNNWHYGSNITIKSKADRYSDGKTDGKNAVSISSPASATAPSGVTPTELAYGTTYEVHKVYGGSNAGGSVYFKTKADNSTSVSKSDIQLYVDDTYQNEPSADAKLTDLVGAINECYDSSNSQHWVKFHITVLGTTKYYKMKIS